MPSLPEDPTCRFCPALCCQYITVEVDNPRSARRKDDIRWYLLHEGITLLIDHGRWLVKLPSRCRLLAPDFTCSIYENRPQTCREYSAENCDYHTEYEGWEMDYIELQSVEEFERFLANRKRKRIPKSALPKPEGITRYE